MFFCFDGMLSLVLYFFERSCRNEGLYAKAQEQAYILLDVDCSPDSLFFVKYCSSLTLAKRSATSFWHV